MTSISYTDIQQGVFFKMDGTVYETIESVYSKKSRQKGSNQVRIKNVVTGAVITKTLRSSDTFEKVFLEKKEYTFVYTKDNEAIIHPTDNPRERISVPAESVTGISLIPQGTSVTALVEGATILTLRLPIKVNLTVKEAPPGVRGNTAQGGTKRVVVETGATVTTPLFIEAGERITINTETGKYVERAK